MSLPAVSKHLKVLEHAGLMPVVATRNGGPAGSTPALRDTADWLEDYRRFWEEHFDRLETRLKELHAKEKKRAREK